MSDNPILVYKYLSFHNTKKKNNEWLKPIFTKNQLYFSSPEFFNDPYDCNTLITFKNAEWPEIYNFVGSIAQFGNFNPHECCEEIRINSPKAKQEKSLVQDGLRDQLINNYGIVSLSSRKKDIVMWSHYAGKHTGICLEFDFSMNRKLDRKSILQVQYNKYPTLKEYVEKRDREHELMEMFLSRKARCWKYEQEWRIIAVIENNKRELSYPPEMLTGIIFGCRTEDRHKNLVREWIKRRNPKPKLYQAKINNDKYKIEIEEIVL